MKHKVWILRIVLIVLIIGWMVMIFGFSAEDGDESQSLSDKITIKTMPGSVQAKRNLSPKGKKCIKK